MLICNTVSAQGSRDVIVSVPTLCIVCALIDKQCTSVQTGFGDAKSNSRLHYAVIQILLNTFPNIVHIENWPSFSLCILCLHILQYLALIVLLVLDHFDCN